jgi:hypothetical protein
MSHHKKAVRLVQLHEVGIPVELDYRREIHLEQCLGEEHKVHHYILREEA